MVRVTPLKQLFILPLYGKDAHTLICKIFQDTEFEE